MSIELSDAGPSGAVRQIRPYRLFTLLEGPLSERVAHVQIPPRRGGGGLTLIETFLVVAAARLVQARRIFEFGTFLGTTTLNLALNSPSDAELLTLDLDEYSLGCAEQDCADAPLTRVHLHHRNEMDFDCSPVRGKIKTLAGDSTRFDFTSYRNSIDLVFVDGGHDFRTVRSDTENAFLMASTDRPSCVAWHDYGNPEYPGLTAYLEDLARERPVFHVGDTMLCFWFHDSSGAIHRKLHSDD